MTTIYGLAASDGVVRYVGKTKDDLESHRRGHVNRARRGFNQRVCEWVRDVADELEIVLLEECEPARAIVREAYWIGKLKTDTDAGGFNQQSKGGPTARPARGITQRRPIRCRMGRRPCVVDQAVS